MAKHQPQSKQAQQPRSEGMEITPFFDLDLGLNCIISAEGQLINANHAFLSLFKYEANEIIGKDISSFVHPEDLDKAYANIQKLCSTAGKDTGFVIRCVDKNAQVLWLEWYSQTINNTLYTSARNITTLKEAEEINDAQQRKLENVNRMQRAMMEASGLFIKATIHNHDDILMESLSVIGKALHVDFMYIYRYDFVQKQAIREMAWYREGLPENPFLAESIDFDDCQTSRAHHLSGQTVFIPVLSRLPVGNFSRRVLEKYGIQTYMTVPLNIDNVYHAFVGAASLSPDTIFTNDDEALMMEYGSLMVNTRYRIQAEKSLLEREELLKATLFSIGDGVICTDNKARITLINHVAEQLTGYTQTEAEGLPFDVVFDIHNEETMQKSPNIVHEVLSTAQTKELANHTALTAKNGRVFEIEDSAAPILSENNTISGVVVVFRDCTEKKEKQRRVEYLSRHDILTGLFNRAHIQSIYATADREESYPLTILYADVNGLKLANDVFGHSTGDRLLIKISKILKSCMRKTDFVGRLGGDEFIILLPDTDEKTAESIKQRILNKAESSYVDHVAVSVAVGYCTKENHLYSFEEIRSRAENRMYHDKLRNGKSMRLRTIDRVRKHLNEQYLFESLHAVRTQSYAYRLACELNLSTHEIETCSQAALLHDIGKITVPPAILNKPSALIDDEYELVKRHAESGYRLLKTINEYEHLAEITLHHHEHWNGSGYPHGLSRDEIPMASRILCVAEAYEAMTGERPYRPAGTHEYAISEILRCKGTQFDPDLCDAFIRMLERDGA